MTRVVALCLVYLSIAAAGASVAQTSNPAMTAPDELAWQFFLEINARAQGGANNALFETWASDSDTFKPSPQFPTGPTTVALHPPTVTTFGRLALLKSGRLLPAVPPGIAQGVSEETRRNRAAFEFIVSNNLYKKSGLVAAFGKKLSFPVAAMEVKANWLPVAQVPDFTNNRVSVADAPKIFHINKGPDGKQYALLSMHVISKAVPNWTWATFENEFNPGRCDIIGCHDGFGAQVANVLPNANPDKGYPACAKTSALETMISSANWDAAYTHYCLKGSQTDFTDSSGLDVRVGNSVTEAGFVNQSSCMTCHGRAAWDNAGNATSEAGFDDNGAPLGPIQPNWYYSFHSQPPIYESMPGLKQIATSADFVWSIAFCAYDDSSQPPTRSNCSGK